MNIIKSGINKHYSLRCTELHGSPVYYNLQLYYSIFVNFCLIDVFYYTTIQICIPYWQWNFFQYEISIYLAEREGGGVCRCVVQVASVLVYLLLTSLYIIERII